MKTIHDDAAQQQSSGLDKAEPRIHPRCKVPDVLLARDMDDPLHQPRASQNATNMRPLFALVTLISAAGCTSQLSIDPEMPAVEERQLSSNYALGARQQVNVGEPMIKVQDVWLRKSSASVAKPDKPTRVSGGTINLLLEPRRQYPVKGVTTMDGEQFTVVAASDSPDGYTGVLVRSDGSLHNRVVFGVSGASVFGRSGHGDTLGNVVYTMTISDPSVRLRREIEQTVIAAKGFESFELLYTGTSPAGLTLTYREFSPEGLARVAFFQNLVYDVGAKVIQFRRFRILVHHASSESISFTVQSDGLERSQDR